MARSGHYMFLLTLTPNLQGFTPFRHVLRVMIIPNWVKYNGNCINPSITRKRGGSHVTVRSADQRYTRCEIKKMDYDHVILPPFPPHARSLPFRFAVTHFLSL